MIIQLEKRFQKKLQGRVEKYAFEVGVLNDGPHMAARRGERGKGGRDVITNYAGGPVRKKSRNDSGLTISQVSKANRDRLGFNYLWEPFQKQDSDIVRFVDTFFKLIFGRSKQRRLENLLQAVVRNPILRGDYGSNSPFTKKVKGFDRYMIDTGQLFKAIKAKVVKNV